MAMGMRRALLALVSFVVGAAVSARDSDAPPWNPFTALRQQHLLALYPLAQDFQDYAPAGSAADGYGQHGTARRVALSSSSTTAAATTAGDARDHEGARLDRTSGIDLPLHIRQAIYLRLTFGAWIYTDATSAQLG